MMQAIIAIFFLGVVGIVVFIAYNIWLGISPTERARELKQRQETWDKAQGDLALTCDRCGEHSPPIPDTGNPTGVKSAIDSLPAPDTTNTADLLLHDYFR
jgi:hypothetical protein